MSRYLCSMPSSYRQKLRCALGIPGILSVIAGIAWLILHFSLQPLLVQRIQKVQQTLKNHTLVTLPTHYLNRPRLPWTAFPSQSKESSLHALFYLQAEKAGISLPDVQYTQRKLVGTPLIEYKIELTTTTTYIALKKWIAAMMSAYPTLILDHLHIERENVQSDQLKCSVTWLWVAHEKSEPKALAIPASSQAVRPKVSASKTVTSKGVSSKVGVSKVISHRGIAP